MQSISNISETTTRNMPEQEHQTRVVAMTRQPSFRGLEWTTTGGSLSRTVARLIPHSIATKFFPPSAHKAMKKWQGGERRFVMVRNTTSEKPARLSTSSSLATDTDEMAVTMHTCSDMARHDSVFSDDKSMMSEAYSSYKNRRSSSLSSSSTALSEDVAASSPSSPSSSSEEDSLPFWNMNIPKEQHTPTCPDFLTYAFENHKDRGILSTPDWQFRRKSWPQVVDLVRRNELFNFERVPSDLRTYKQYCGRLASEHGSIMNYIMKERLHWDHLDPSGDEPFTNSNDYKILRNDWPYGIDTRIIHLVVWVRFELPTDPTSEIGDMSPATREMLSAYVDRTFAAKCGKENVLWFKNWNALKSVHAVEHFHVMLFDPDPEFVKGITGGDVPLQEKLRAMGEL